MSSYNKYPKSVAAAYAYLSDYSDGEVKQKKSSSSMLQFVQYGDRVCYKCGEKGHMANKCPLLSKDHQVDDSSSMNKPAMTAMQLADELTALALPNAPQPPSV